MEILSSLSGCPDFALAWVFPDGDSILLFRLSRFLPGFSCRGEHRSSATFVSCEKYGESMKFSRSLKLNHIFRRLYSSSGHANSYLVLYARRNRTATNRVGVTVSKKLGGAVVRNRVRRRLREVYRLHEERFSPGWDIVVVARSRCIGADFGKLTLAYLSLAEKAGLLQERL